MPHCQGCGLEHDLWTSEVPGLGRQHDRAPLGFDGTGLANSGNSAVSRVWVSSHVDFTLPGWPVVDLCQWCALDLKHRVAQRDSLELRRYDTRMAALQQGQQSLGLPW